MKKILNELIGALTLAGSGGAYWYFSGRLSQPCQPLALFCLLPCIWIIIIMSLPQSCAQKAAFLCLGGIDWSQEDFVRGWLITGRTGSGKTAAAICNILEALFKNGQKWGGIAVDDKGLFYNILVKACAKYNQSSRLILLQVRPENSTRDWEPQYAYNLISDLSIPASSYAQSVIDVYKSIVGSGGNPFFINQAGIQIEKAIEVLRMVNPRKCTLKTIYRFFAYVDEMNAHLDALASQCPNNSVAYDLIFHFVKNYLGQAPEQRSGVKTTIESCLSYFTNPDIAEIFCPEENSVDFGVIDQGIILCASLPNKYEIERNYINTFLKLAYYKHALRRFDKAEAEREKDNLLVLLADEAQQIVTSAEKGMSDFSVIDKIREAKATGIFCSQSTTSFIPFFGSLEKTKVFLLNLGNHIYFTVADADAAKLAAEHIGQRTVQKKTTTTSSTGYSYSYTDHDEYCLKPFVLRNMKKFECVIVHCEKGFKKTKLSPTALTRPTEGGPENLRGQPHASGNTAKDGTQNEADSADLTGTLKWGPQTHQELYWPRSEIESTNYPYERQN